MKVCRGIFWIFILFALVSGQSAAIIGYDIEAHVNSTTFEFHRETQEMNFQLSGSVDGSGNFSRYSDLQGFAGVEARSRSASPLKGNLSYEEKVLLQSREGPVVIKATLESEPVVLNPPGGQDGNIPNEAAGLYADERWPTYYANYKKVSYAGPGMWSSEVYNNDGDVVASSHSSWKLAETSLYRAYINRSLLLADITSDGITAARFTNRSSSYALSLDWIGQSAHLGVLKQSQSSNSVSQISQDYVGSLKTSVQVSMNEYFADRPEAPGWLDCCCIETNDPYLTTPSEYRPLISCIFQP